MLRSQVVLTTCYHRFTAIIGRCKCPLQTSEIQNYQKYTNVIDLVRMLSEIKSVTWKDKDKNSLHFESVGGNNCSRTPNVKLVSAIDHFPPSATYSSRSVSCLQLEGAKPLFSVSPCICFRRSKTLIIIERNYDQSYVQNEVDPKSKLTLRRNIL